MDERGMRWIRAALKAALTAAVFVSATTATAMAEDPVILPVHGALKAGHTGSIEVVPPADATSCAATFYASGRQSRVVRFKPHGPSRKLQWKVARHVAGTWTVLVTCDGGGSKSAASSFTNTRLAVHKRGKAKGSLVRGRVRISAGILRDLPPTRTRASLRNEPDTSQWTECGSYWMTKAHVAGSGAATRVSFVPTRTAKLFGVAGPIWDALNNCVRFPGLRSSEVDSLYKQLVCHVTYGLLPGAGSTWDFEAWRADPSWATAMNPANKCQNWGNLVGVGGEFQGRIVHSEDDPGAAYVVDNQDGIYLRKHIFTTKAYGCLVNTGHSEAPKYLPQGFFDDELPQGAAVGDEACGSATSGGGTGGTSGGSGGSTGGGGGGGHVTLAQGPAAPSGYRYAVSVSGFAPNSSVSVSCFDSVSPGGFYTFSLSVDGSGSGSTSSQCYSGDGPDHWVIANGIESNRVTWGGGSTPPPPPPPTYSETTGGAAHTWTNYTNAGGTEGPTIPAYATVQIACKIPGFRVADGNTWWYRIAQSPWNSQYYVSADAFYNNGQTSGSLHGTPFVDPSVRDC